MEFKASEIAAFLNGEVIGDKDVKVSNVSKIEEGKIGTLAFLANPKYENFLYTTDASIVLVNKGYELHKEVKATLILVDNAYQAFASLLDLYMQAQSSLKTGIEQPCYIDSSAQIGEGLYIGAFAYIGKNVKIGNNSKIFPQVYVGDNVEIGENSILYAGCKIYSDCKIGSGCIIHSGAVIGSDGFGFAPQNDHTYKKIAQIGNVVVEDNVEIGANTTIDCSTMGSTLVKKGVKLDNLIQIAHNCEIGENTVIAAQAGLAGSTKIGKNCKVGGQAGLAGHISIGDNVQIAAQSGIMHNIKENEALLGTPAVDFRKAMKIYAITRNLPNLWDKINELQKEIIKLKSKA